MRKKKALLSNPVNRRKRFTLSERIADAYLARYEARMIADYSALAVLDPGVAKAAVKRFGSPKRASEWLERPELKLKGGRPFEVAKTSKGVSAVLALLIPGFDAVKESRRWRRATGKILNRMTFEQQQTLLRKTTDGIVTDAPESIRQAYIPLHRERTERQIEEMNAIRVMDPKVDAAAVECFGSAQAALAWLTSPEISLEGRKPIEIARTRKGAKEILLLLKRIDYGIAT